jgi:hypothetical protein
MSYVVSLVAVIYHLFPFVDGKGGLICGAYHDIAATIIL